MTTTAATRNKIYRRALSHYRYQIKHTYHKMGICHAISEVIQRLNIDAPSPYWNMNEYPELFAHKHKEINSLLTYWWDVYDTAIRINALKNAIVQTDKIMMNPELNFNTDPIDTKVTGS